MSEMKVQPVLTLEEVAHTLSEMGVKGYSSYPNPHHAHQMCEAIMAEIAWRENLAKDLGRYTCGPISDGGMDPRNEASAPDVPVASAPDAPVAPAQQKFRRKHEEFWASRWWEFGDHPAVQHVPLNRVQTSLCCKCWCYSERHGWLGDNDGGRYVCPGDWIICKDSGEVYPCRHELFSKLYEPVEDAK